MSLNKNYLAARLRGVAMMLEDAKTGEETANAIGHYFTVKSETDKALKEAGLLDEEA